MVLVTLVPMFAPMIIGMADLTGTSVATRPTMMEVKVRDHVFESTRGWIDDDGNGE